MNSDMVIMIVSCDHYSDAWDTFFYCIDKYWNDCRYVKFLVNNEKTCLCQGVININTGPEVSWSSKVRTALEHIDSQYILLLLEDYFFVEKIISQKIDEYLSFMKSNDIDYLSFMPVKGMAKTAYEGISYVTEENIYGKVLQPSIWKKECLQKCLFNNEFSAWEFEAKQKILSPLRVIGNDCCTSELALSWKNGILQGKWYPPTIHYLKKHGIYINTDGRKRLSLGKTMKYKLKSRAFKLMSVSMIKKTRKVLEKLGYSFVTPS